ncbi:MAG TPA: protein kinase [Thermoanaerobaculia bacterium]|jgi:serine/threonine protein kinase/tetratricopeptide (TPR) repeat protein
MQGKRISHFEILEPLGSGGMGVVYKARDLTLGRTVALKFLPALSHEERDRKRFFREARAASRLNHPGICTIHEVGEDADGQLFLCMELCEGETLKARLQRGPLPLAEALDVAIQLASALAVAHRAGIVHRDIKPANIVVNENNKVKVLDFGLALTAGETRITHAGRAVGTVVYMSPEQIGGREIDQRSDLWSLGVVLFEMLTGRFPFEGASDWAVLEAVVNRQPESLTKLRPGLPRDLDRLLARLLAKDPEARIAAAPVLEQELLQIQQGIDSQEDTRAFSPQRRKLGRLRLAAAGLLGVAALSGLAFAFRNLGRNEGLPRVHSLAVLPFSNVTGDADRDYFGDGLSSVLISQLSEVPGLNVVSRSEAGSYKGSRKGARQIAKELGVQDILEGEVAEIGERVRVDAKLVDGETGFVLWSRQLEGNHDELFRLQDRLTREVVKALSLSLDAAERRRLSRKPTASLEAYDFYLQARSLLDDVDHPEDLDSACELFRKALGIDPDFALAHAGLSEALMATYKRDRDPGVLAEARSRAERALTIDPSLPGAHIALARVDWNTGRRAQSILELRRLVALHPESDAAYLELAISYEEAGDLSKAEITTRQAIAMRPEYWGLWNYLGGVLQSQGDFAGAREAYEKAIATAPSELSWPTQNLAAMETQQGNFAAAIEIYERLPRPISNAGLAANIGNAYFSAGRLGEAEEYFRLALRLQPKNHLWHRNLADLRRRRGDTEGARGEYLSAAQLVSKELAVNPGQETLEIWKALYLAEAGACGEALPVIRRLEKSIQSNAGSSWRIAQAYAVCGQRVQAIAAIRRALENGYPAASISQQDEFKPLLSDPALASLATAVRSATH